MRILFFAGVILLFINASARGQEYGAATNATERKILRLINSLPEVQRENKFRKVHKISHLLKAFIQSTPTKESNYYQVSISEDLGFQLRTYQWYEVDAKTFVIRYLDIVSGKSMTLSEMRKLNKKKPK